MDKYLKAKKQSMAMHDLIQLIILYACLKTIKKALENEKEFRFFRMISCRMALLMYIKLGKPMRMQGGI